jgi:glycine/D-amino acid oxidase-like deaminating enzyme
LKILNALACTAFLLSLSNKRFDVCVIGGGLIGLCSAYQLSKKGLKVVLLERGDRVAPEASQNNGAVSWPFMQMLDEPFLYRFVLDGIEAHKRLSNSGIKYDFRTIGAIHVFFSEKELQAQAKRLRDLPSTEKYDVLDKKALHDLEPAYSDTIVGGVLYPNCAQGLAQKLDESLAAAIVKQGSEIRTSTEARSFGRDSALITTARTTKGNVSAKSFVMAAGPWCSAFSDELGFGMPTVPVKGHLVTWKTSRAPTSHLMVVRRGAILPIPDGSVRVGGGMDYTGYDKTPNERVVRILTGSAIEAIPSLAEQPFEVWAGLRPGTPDALPIIGFSPPYQNLVVAAGHYHEGFTTCAITGEIVAELISEGGSSRPYLSMFRPGRFNA